MKRYIFFSALFAIFNLHIVVAQTPLPEFGVYSNEEVAMTECSFDKEAEAVVLLDEANAYYDDDYHLITDRRVRIKILNQKGLDRGSVRIDFYSKNKFEFITKIEAMTYTPGSDPLVSTVDRKSIFTQQEDDRFSSVRFALPNVKVGSIIEYKYESIMNTYGGLDHWIFQSDIPTLKSCFLVEILPNVEFSYLLSKKKNYAVTIKQRPEEGRTYFEMDNIPGLRFEPYMDAIKDHLQKVEFQFSGYTNRFGDKQNVNTTWKELANSLLTDEYLGKTLKKELSAPDDLTARVAAETTTTGKVTVIYNYVKDNFTWNGENGKYALDGLKKVWDKRSGRAGELNLVLLNLLQGFKIDAAPLLVAERDFGKVDPNSYPFADDFNKTVAWVSADNKNFILDATQKYCPASLIPYNLLNTFALLIDKKTTTLMQIAGNGESYLSKVQLDASLDKNGSLRGSCVIRSDEYAKEAQVQKIKADQEKFIRTSFEEPYEGVKVDSFNFESANTDTTSLIQHIHFTDHVDETGGFFLLNYNLFTDLGKNPFKANERFTNVSFGYPYHVTIEETIELPANSKTDDLLKSKTLETPNRDIIVSREIKRTGNILNIKIIFNQSVTLVTPDLYPGLKVFYKAMIDMLNEPVVIKL